MKAVLDLADLAFVLLVALALAYFGVLGLTRVYPDLFLQRYSKDQTSGLHAHLMVNGASNTVYWSSYIFWFCVVVVPVSLLLYFCIFLMPLLSLERFFFIEIPLVFSFVVSVAVVHRFFITQNRASSCTLCCNCVGSCRLLALMAFVIIHVLAFMQDIHIDEVRHKQLERQSEYERFDSNKGFLKPEYIFSPRDSGVMEDYQREELVNATGSRSTYTKLIPSKTAALPYIMRSYGLGLANGGGFFMHSAIKSLAERSRNDTDTVLRGHYSPQREKMRKRHYVAPVDISKRSRDGDRYNMRTRWPGQIYKFFACAENCDLRQNFDVTDGNNWSEVIFVPIDDVEKS